MRSSLDDTGVSRVTVRSTRETLVTGTRMEMPAYQLEVSVASKRMRKAGETVPEDVVIVYDVEEMMTYRETSLPAPVAL